MTSVPEHFNCRISDILSGAEGVVSMTDDILVFGRNQSEHDTHLYETLRRIDKAALTTTISVNSLSHVFNF